MDYILPFFALSKTFFLLISKQVSVSEDDKHGNANIVTILRKRLANIVTI